MYGRLRDTPIRPVKAPNESHSEARLFRITVSRWPARHIHNRQVVVLEHSDWRAWLRHERPEAELLLPLPAGSLRVEQVR